MQRRDFCKATLMGGALTTLPSAHLRLLAVEAVPAVGSDLTAVTLTGEPTVIPAAAVSDFAAGLHGQLLTARDAQYEQARRIWNKMIDRRPALIVRCSGAADVTRAVAFARERRLLVAIRGGGHSFPGYSVCEGGLVIDLSAMRHVRVDPHGRTARAAGGACLGDVDWETQQYGLATPMGAISHTGIGGLTLGGGYGWLSRRFGLACDNLISADLITADARLLHVSAEENPDLFWAIRGGGGNFGVVTSFEYRLHPLGPQVLAGGLAYDREQLPDVLEHYSEFALRAPRELALEVGGEEGDGAGPTLVVCYNGDPTEGERLLQPLRTAINPREDTIKRQAYVKVQQQFDGPWLSSGNHYLKGGFVAQVTAELIDGLVHDVGVDPLMTVTLEAVGGAIADVAPTATAVAHRREPFQLLVDATWPDATDNERNRAKAHVVWENLSRFTTGFYVNLNSADQRAIDDNYGPNRQRLAQLKKRYDPENVFRLNANVRPAA